MSHVNPDLPADGTTADVDDYNIPIQAILSVLNGHIDATNIEAGSLPWSIMDTFTNAIPAAAMQDSGNLVKYRDEINYGIVIDGGLIWSAISGLNATMTAGTAYTKNGLRHAVSSIASRAFTASRDTYIEVLSNGNVDYVEVTNGAAMPALGTDSVRLAKVVTNGSAITSVTDLRITPTSPRSYSKSFGITATPQVVSGLPFKPNTVMAFFVPGAGTNDRTYFGQGIASRPEGTQHAWSSSSDGASSRRDKDNTKLISVVADNTGAVIAAASITAWTDDGFTITVTVANNAADVIEWVALP